MAKYNPTNIKHRAWLASNILDLLQKWGFTISFEHTEDTWEFVLSRPDKFRTNKTIIVYTSIDKRDAAVRKCGSDRVRFVVKTATKDGDFHQRIARVNRVGEFREINNRICEAIKKAQVA